jgi:hypothetical protein
MKKLFNKLKAKFQINLTTLSDIFGLTPEYLFYILLGLCLMLSYLSILIFKIF